ncbi:MAG: NADH-quinone oxidoreductase subunit NuoF [Desulfobacterota bacterium]|nr:NADH-quinone oxidoreductase subunit NuoF [Thermodesulfobacteriota bacterium]
MNTKKLDERRKKAEKEWAKFQNNRRPLIYVGAGSCGLAAGASEVLTAMEAYVKDKKQEVDVVKVGCIGPCYLEPLVDIQMPGQPRISYSNVTADNLPKLLGSYLEKRQVYKPRLVGHFGTEAFDGVPRFFDHPMLAPQVRIVLRNCGMIDPENLDHYLARDGYKGIEKALAMPWNEVLETVKNSGIRGRGGAGFPTWRKWLLCRENESAERYLICNADEGDPGAFMNRSLIEGDPHALLEGMLIAAYTIGATHGYIYIRAEYPLAVERLKGAIADISDLGLLGENILGSGFNFDIKIKEGAGAFVCGEETALIGSIEGRRGMPRTRPPFPAASGLWGKPTIINNVETLGTLPNILRNGAEWYSQYGTESSKGTKTFSLVGKVRRTGLIEVPLGTTLRKVIFEIGGGLVKEFKAVQTGGPSGGCLGREFLDTPIDYENLAAAGSIMGSGGLIVIDRDTCIVDTAKYYLSFTQAESCGKCVPCRVGTRHLVNILTKICKGQAELTDIAKLENLAKAVKGASLCGLGQTAPNPVLSSLKYFREEFLAHIMHKRCPAAVCRDLVVYRIIKEKCTGCQRCVQVCPTGAITGPRSEVHNLDESKCIKCRSCYEICRFDAIAGDAIIIES